MTLSFSLSLFVADGGRARRFLRCHRPHFRNKIDSRLPRHERLTSRLANRSRLIKFCLELYLQIVIFKCFCSFMKNLCVFYTHIQFYEQGNFNTEKMRGKEKKRERFRRFLQRHYYHFRNKIDPHSSRDK